MRRFLYSIIDILDASLFPGDYLQDVHPYLSLGPGSQFAAGEGEL